MQLRGFSPISVHSDTVVARMIDAWVVGTETPLSCVPSTPDWNGAHFGRPVFIARLRMLKVSTRQQSEVGRDVVLSI